MFRRFLFPLALAVFAAPFAAVDAQDQFTDAFTPNANRWSIMIYASSGKQNSPGFLNFDRLATALRSNDAEENVVVFSPFEARSERRPTRETLDALLAWLRQNDQADATLGLPAARGDRSAPLEIRLFLCGRVEGTALRLPDSSQTVELDAFRSALRDGPAPCERTLLFFNLASETRTRGASAVLAPPLVDDAIFENEAPLENATPFLEGYYRTSFFNQSDAEFFAELADAFEGNADGLRADGIVTALELLEHLGAVAPIVPETERIGQDFPVAKSGKTPSAPPSKLFSRAAEALRKKNRPVFAQEAERRAREARRRVSSGSKRTVATP